VLQKKIRLQVSLNFAQLVLLLKRLVTTWLWTLVVPTSAYC